MAQIKTRLGDDAPTAILLAAGRILRGEGASALTVTRVAAEVGVTKAAIYHHFRNLDDLRQAVYAPLIEAVAGIIEQTGERGARAEAFIDLMAQHRELVEICFAFPAGATAASETDRRLLDLRERLDVSLRPEGDDGLCVQMFFGACAAALADPAFSPDRLPRIRRYLKILLDL